MSREEVPNFRTTNHHNCLSCYCLIVDYTDPSDRVVYRCDKFGFIVPDKVSEHVCDGWEED